MLKLQRLKITINIRLKNFWYDDRYDIKFVLRIMHRLYYNPQGLFKGIIILVIYKLNVTNYKKL